MNSHFAERNNMAEGGVLRGIAQAARALDALARAPAGLRLTDVANALGIPKPTALRMIRSWSALGYVEADAQGRYRLGWKVFELAAAHQESIDLRSLAHPFLVEINAECGETAHLTVLDRSEVLYIDKVESSEPIRVFAAIGRRAPLHATAAGKAMLAHQPSSFLDGYLSKGLVGFTEKTISSPDKLVRELKRIRERGYALNLGEWHHEVGSVAAPVFRFDGNAWAALSATLPLVSLTRIKMRELSHLVITESGRLSRSLGHVDSEVGTAKRELGSSEPLVG